jgi:hypothetical protein
MWEEHVSSFRVEVCSVRNRLDYMGKMEESYHGTQAEGGVKKTESDRARGKK